MSQLTKDIYAISSGFYEGIPVIYIEGDMTSESDAEVKKVFHALTASMTMEKLIINFEKTKYINSSGIATLISIIQSVNEVHGGIAFVALSDHFRKVMDIVGITDFVRIFATNREAFDGFTLSR